VLSACQSIYQTAAACVLEHNFPIFLGGDHSIAMGTIGGVSTAATTGVIWIDAHADFNTPESSPSGNLHGMPLSHLVGLGLPELVNLGRPGAKIDPHHVVLIGLRNLDPGERDELRRLGMRAYTMRDIDEINPILDHGNQTAELAVELAASLLGERLV